GVEYSKTAHFPEISDETKQSALKKAERIGLNLDNFIFISPESMSNESPNKNYWCDLCDKYYNAGFDIFINAINQSPDYGFGKTCFLTFDEAYYIASLSKKIIGLRSGFIEILTSIKNVPITCLYTDFKDRGILKPIAAEKVMSAFSLKKLPNANEENIKEIIGGK
ncbi:MAG: hypothetical protein LUH05_08885, partial [Candidatus Gastranaerophilales bacterium]|nr:hypothetical protein [Candidatus Gastranaerophilales bacterium]